MKCSEAIAIAAKQVVRVIVTGITGLVIRRATRCHLHLGTASWRGGLRLGVIDEQLLLLDVVGLRRRCAAASKPRESARDPGRVETRDRKRTDATLGAARAAFDSFAGDA